MLAKLNRYVSLQNMGVAALQLCRFRDPVSRIAAHWFKYPIQRIVVRKLSDFTSTADGACRVAFNDNMVGFVKPKPAAQNPLVVANEKIAADLGHLLTLPVAPVVIREPINGTEWRAYSSMSLGCLAAGRHWGDGPPPHSPATTPGLEALRVFWSWIGDVDHGGHPHNLLFERRDGVCQLLSIDHSNSFGIGGNGDILTVAASAGYGADQQETAESARRIAVGDIKDLDWSAVEHVVMRLVGTVLPHDEAVRILGWLADRRRILGGLMNVGGTDG